MPPRRAPPRAPAASNVNCSRARLPHHRVSTPRRCADRDAQRPDDENLSGCEDSANSRFCSRRGEHAAASGLPIKYSLAPPKRLDADAQGGQRTGLHLGLSRFFSALPIPSGHQTA